MIAASAFPVNAKPRRGQPANGAKTRLSSEEGAYARRRVMPRLGCSVWLNLI